MQLEFLNKEIENELVNLEFEKFGQLNVKFHQLIYEKCNNHYLIDQINMVTNKMDTVRSSAFVFVPQRVRKSIDEHAAIIKLLKEKAPFQEIEDAARQHKLNTADAIKKSKSKKSQPYERQKMNITEGNCIAKIIEQSTTIQSRVQHWTVYCGAFIMRKLIVNTVNCLLYVHGYF